MQRVQFDAQLRLAWFARESQFYSFRLAYAP